MNNPVLDSATAYVDPFNIRDSSNLPPGRFEVEDDLPGDSYPTFVDFPAKSAMVQIECYEDNNWIAFLKDDEAVFSEGDSAEEAEANLVESAREDLRILSEYGTNLSAALLRRRALLESLF